MARSPYALRPNSRHRIAQARKGGPRITASGASAALRATQGETSTVFNTLNSNALNPSPSQQQGLPAFSFGQASQQSQQQPNGTSFGQSQSFPQTNTSASSTAMNGAQSFGGFGSSQSTPFSFNTPSTSSFQFAPPQSNNSGSNIFGGSSTNQGGASGFGGFQGSIFSIPRGEADSSQSNAQPTVTAPASTPSLFGQPSSTSQPTSNIFNSGRNLSSRSHHHKLTSNSTTIYKPLRPELELDACSTLRFSPYFYTPGSGPFQPACTE